MKKQIQFGLIVISFVFVSVRLLAQPVVNTDDALVVAKNFYHERLAQKQHVLPGQLTINSIVPCEKDGFILYYAVNIGNGFVLVSGVRNVWPVPAYSFEGCFSLPENEANVVAWLGQYEKQIMHAFLEQKSATREISQAWDKYIDRDFRPNAQIKMREMEPLLYSKWNQGKYYNEFCPADPAGPGGHCYAGCVATAMGQVAFYFRFPETGIGSYSYYHPDYDTISADFGNTTYQWNEMVNSVGSSNSAVAELLFHLGVSVDMVYGPNGSGMYNHKAAYSLRTYFKYSPETQYVFRDSTNMDWDSLLITHLDQRIPMYYAGWSVPNINGHAFVCDGYQGDHFYHFNWGWGGSYDGYFYTNELSPGGSNFNLAQELIIHGYPDTNLYAFPVYCNGLTELTAPEGTIEDGSGPIHYYQNGANCSYLINPQNAEDSISDITLSFDKFGLGENDFINVFDGGNENAPLLGSFTGDEIPETVVSSGNQLFITFQTDEGDSSHGFLTSYDSQQPQWCSGIATLVGTEGTVEDGSGSFFYNNNQVCMWQIIPTWASEVILTFTKFNTEAGSDVLKIYDLASNQLLATYSGNYEPGNLPAPVTSPSGKMFLVFTSNSYVRADGWEATYSAGNVGIAEKDQKGPFLIYPNPVRESFMIESQGKLTENMTLKLMNNQGMMVVEKDISPAQWPVNTDISDFPSGIYFLKLETEQSVFVKKIVID